MPSAGQQPHSEILLAALHVAAAERHLPGTVAVRIGRGVSTLGGILECVKAFLWWWRMGRPAQSWYHEQAGSGRANLV